MFLILMMFAKISSQQSHQQEELNYLNFPKINIQKEQVYGCISKYSPLSNFIYLENLEKTDYNCYLIYMAKQVETKELRLVYYVEFLVQLQKIVHFFIVQACSNYIEVQFDMDNLSYEGNWCFHYLYFKDETELIVGLDCGNQLQFKTFQSDLNCFQDLIFIHGQHVQILKDSSKQNLQLINFPGEVKLYQINNIILQKEYKDKFYEGINQTLNVNPLISYLQYSSLNIKNIISQFYYHRSYDIQFWSKINIKEDNQQYISILKIKPHNFQQNLNIFQLTYIKIQEQWSYYIEYCSYNYPFVYNIDLIKEFQKSFSENIDEELITQWHFIEIKYVMNIFIFKLDSFLTNQRYQIKFKQVYQFSDILLNFQFGIIDNQKINIDGEIALFNYFNYVNLISQLNEQERQQNCHYSCYQCWGPFNNQCLSCLDSDNRIYDQLTNTCQCKLWYVEENQQKCYGSIDMNFKETYNYLPDNNRYESIDQDVICAFGYFKYQDNCIQCPSASQKGILNCLECLENPELWLTKSVCEEQYFQFKGSTNNVYMQTQNQKRQTALFFVVNEELVGCDGCDLCTEQDVQEWDIKCILYGDKHLDKDVYITCYYGVYQYDLKKCLEDQELDYYHDQSQQCSQGCGYCMFNTCLYCIDSSRYFMDVLGICRTCDLQNCKYCFQYNKYDKNQVSIQLGEISQNQEDYIVACSLCFPGYVFNFETNQCVEYTPNNQCVDGFISEDGQFICTYTLLSKNEIQKNIAIYFNDCQNYYSNCSKCLQDFNGMIQCVECDYGYFLNFKNGICQLCSAKFKNSELCQMITSSQDNWKYQVQSFYLNFKPNKVPVLVQGMYFIEWYDILKCDDGYILYGLSCDKLKNQDCLQFDIASQTCKVCKNSVDDLPVLSFFDNQCQQCPYPCQVCQKISLDQIQAINPYFIINEQSIKQTYFCVINFKEDYTFIESSTGQIKGKDQSKRRYNLQLESNSFPSLHNPIQQFNVLKTYLQRVKPDIYIYKHDSESDQNPINLREQIYSLRNQTFLYDGYNDSQHDKQFVIANQSTVNLKNLRIFYQSNYFFIHSTFGVSIFISNISISNLDLQQTIFQITQATNVYINTISLSNVKLLNQPLFSIKHYQKQSNTKFYIHIENIILMDSNLTNSSIISFFAQSESEFSYLTINQITVINTYLQNSSIIKIHSITFNIQYQAERILFKNSNMLNCTIFNIPISNRVFISTLDIIQCKISDSILITVVSSFSLYNVLIYQSTFYKSSLIILTQQLKKNGYNYLIQNLKLNTLDFCGVDLISIKNDKDQNGQIKLQDFEIKNISFSCQNSCNSSQCIFTYSSHTIQIENVLINNKNNQWTFCLQKFTLITINNVIIQGNNQFSYLSSQINQLKSIINQGLENCGVFYIQDFVNIEINNLQIKNYFILNSALILLISKGQALNYQKIIINYLQIHNNYLIKTESTQFASLLYIYSEYFCETIINQSLFKNNLILHFIEDYSFISPGLIYVQVYQQNIYMDNNIFYQNAILNTSNSLIYLNSNQVKIKEMRAQNINYDPNQIIQDIYSKSIGGVIFAKTELFVINNSIFINLYSYQASCFFLELIKLGSVELNNIYIENATSWSNDQEFAVGGCLGVNSINSKLNLNLNSIKIINCKSKNQNGFLYLIPSTISNQIIFNDIIFTNVFSQSKIIFDFDFQGNNQLNSVKLYNIIINLDEIQYYQSFSKILEQINQTRNGIISIFNSNIYIKNLYFEGIATQNILTLQFSNSILLSNLYLNQVNALSNDLITISNRGFIVSENSFQQEILNIAITNITIFKSQFSESNIDNFLSNSFLSIIIGNINKNQQIKLDLTKIQLIENSCQQCLKGLIYLQLNQNLKKCKISDLFLYNNYCGQSNCLLVNQSEHLQMSKSIFISNKNNGAMNLQIDQFIGKNLIYLNNIGIIGGGLYYKSTNELNNLKNIYFINNSADVGGAIYIENTRISPNTLSSIFFIDNKANNLISNVREQPSHLQLSLFGQRIMTIRDINQGKPNFRKFNIDNFIFIPSGQKIGNYEQQISNQVILNKIYNIQLKILPINTLDEVQIEKENSLCILNLSDQMNQDNIVINKVDQQEQKITYNISSQSFDLSNHSIVLDPYSKEIQFQRFKFQCNCIRNLNYTFQFNAKSFECKMGEYYFESQCLLCDYKKGFYSVELKAYNCQKVDPKIIKSNTINNIELYPGYWRPNIRSHYISKCQKKISNCKGGWQTGDDTCKEGTIGALCEECDVYNFRGYGQYFKNQKYQCEICSGYAGEILFSLFINLIAIVSIYLTVISVNSVFKSFKLLKQTTKYYKIIFCSNLDQSAALIKMIVNYCQILVSIKSFQSDLYLNIIDILMPISNPIGSSTFSFECYFASSSKIKIIYLTQIMYIILPAIYYLFFLTSYLILVIWQKMILTSTIYFTALIYLFFYTQPNIIKQFGGLIAHRTISMIDYININTSYLYYTQEHQNWVQFFIGPILIIFGGIIPLLLLLILYKIRNYFHIERTRKIWGYLFNDYKENSYYWEIIKIFQREVIMLSLIINEERVILKSVITLLVLILYFFIFLYFQPYNLQALNQFEQESILLCGIIIILSSLHFQTKLMGQENFDNLLQILQIIFSLYFIYTIIKKVVQVYYTKYNERLDQIRKKILQKYPQIKYMCPWLKNILILRSERKKIALSRFQMIKKALIQQRINIRQKILHYKKVSLGSPFSIDYGEQTFIMKLPSIQ